MSALAECVCGAPLGSNECNMRGHLRGPQPNHDCSTCAECIHDGNECCGCYDGACCVHPVRTS